MAPLPPETTARYYVDYVSGERHTMIIRADGGFSPAAFGTFIDGFYTAIAPLMNSFAVEQVRWSAAGSNVSNPVVTGIEGNTYGAGGVTAGNDRSKFLGFQGRSGDGRRVSFQLYSVADINGSYRLDPTEAPDVGTAVGLLNAEPDAALSISGSKAVWKAYANTTDSAYWQKELRT